MINNDKIQKYKQENTQNYNKIMGNLTSKNRQLVEKNEVLKLGFLDMFDNKVNEKCLDFLKDQITLKDVENGIKMIDFMNEHKREKISNYYIIGNKEHEEVLKNKIGEKNFNLVVQNIKEIQEDMLSKMKSGVPNDELVNIIRVDQSLYYNAYKIYNIATTLESDNKFDLRQDTRLLTSDKTLVTNKGEPNETRFYIDTLFSNSLGLRNTNSPTRSLYNVCVDMISAKVDIDNLDDKIKLLKSYVFTDVYYNEITQKQVTRDNFYTNYDKLNEYTKKTSNELIDTLKPIDVADKNVQMYLAYDTNRDKIKDYINNKDYTVYSLSKGKSVSDILEKVNNYVLSELQMYEFGFKKEIVNKMANNKELLDVLYEDNETAKELVVHLSNLYNDAKMSEVLGNNRGIYEKLSLGWIDTKDGKRFHPSQVENIINTPNVVEFLETIIDFTKVDIKERLNIELPNDLRTQDVFPKSLLAQSTLVDWEKKNLNVLDFETFAFDFDYKIQKQHYGKTATAILKENGFTSNSNKRLLALHNDKIDTLLEKLNKTIDKMYPLGEKLDATTFEGLSNRVLEEYGDLIDIRMNLEHTVEQDLKYAKIFNSKLNINKQTLEKMEQTPFNDYFKFVEFDNDVNFESFKRNIDSTGTLTMDELEQKIRLVEPLLEKIGTNELDLRFRKLGNLQKINNKELVNGVYIPKHNCIAIDINNANSYNSLMHELGHFIDYTKNNEFGLLSTSEDFKGIANEYRNVYYTLSMSNPMLAVDTIKDYLTKSTEIFARAFEFYLDAKGLVSDFNKNDEAVKSINDGYIFTHLKEETQAKIINFFDNTLDLKKDVELCKENILNDMKNISKDKEIHKLKTDKSDVYAKLNEKVKKEEPKIKEMKKEKTAEEKRLEEELRKPMVQVKLFEL